MPHVSIREIETFREASAWTEERARLDILRVAGLTRREVRQNDARIPIELVGEKWMAFEKDLPKDKKFDFAFTCQFLSFLTPSEIEQIYRSVYKRLSRGDVSSMR